MLNAVAAEVFILLEVSVKWRNIDDIKFVNKFSFSHINLCSLSEVKCLKPDCK